MANKLVSTFLSSILLSSSLISGCVTNPEYGSGTQAMTAVGDPEEVECADCDLKEAIEAKKKRITSLEKTKKIDEDSIAALKQFNETLESTIKDYDKRIATLKNSGMQGFKFVLEGALAVLEVESLIGLAKAFKCLKPTAKVPVVVNGVTVKGPKIMKFGLAVKDPKKVKMFIAKVAVKGTAAAANDPDQKWTDIALGYLPLTSTAKLPQRWDEWVNADDLIAVLDASKTEVEGHIKDNQESIKGLEDLLKRTEENIQKEKDALKALEEELAAKGGMCSIDEEADDAESVPTPTYVVHATQDFAMPMPGEPTSPMPVMPVEPVEPIEPIEPPTEPTMCAAEEDFVDWEDPSNGCDGTRLSEYVEGTGLPAAGPDNTTFPWGYSF